MECRWHAEPGSLWNVDVCGELDGLPVLEWSALYEALHARP